MFPVFGVGLVPEKRVEVFRGTDPAADSKTGCVHMEEARDKIIKEEDRIVCTRVSVGLIVAVVYAVVGLSCKACKIISSGNDERGSF